MQISNLTKIQITAKNSKIDRRNIPNIHIIIQISDVILFYLRPLPSSAESRRYRNVDFFLQKVFQVIQMGACRQYLDKKQYVLVVLNEKQAVLPAGLF